MALDLGELVGYLKLDTGDWDTKLDGLPGKMSGGAVKMGAAGLALGTALGAAIIGGVNDAMEAEQGMADKAAALGMTEQEAARAGEIAGSAYRNNFGESLDQAQGVVSGLMSRIDAMGTASDATVESMTAKVLTFSSAYEMDTTEAINMVGQMLDNGLAPSAESAMDLMTTAMQSVPAALRGDMVDAINEYGPHLAAMGYSGEEAFTMLAANADKGMYGIDKTGDAMKELSIRSTDMSAASVEAYEAMGLNADEMAAKMLAGGEDAREATDAIVAGLLGMDDPAAQANAAIALFGTPLEDLAVSDIPDFLGSLQSLDGGFSDTEGAAQQMVDTVSNTAGSGMASFQRELQMVFMEIGENFLPALTSVFGFLNEHKDLIPIIVTALGALALGLTIAAAAQWVMNSALLANPMTWIIVGVMALIAAIVLLVMHWDTVVAWLGDVWAGIVEWFKGTLDAIGEWWDGVWSAVSEFFVNLWNGIVDWFTGLWDGLVEWWTGVVDGVVDWWNDLWAGVGKAWSLFWRSIWDTLRGIWNTLVGWFRGALNAYVSFWTGIWNGIKSTFTAVWNTLVSWVKTLVSGWITGWQNLFNGLATFFSGLWDGIKESTMDAWNAVTEWLGGIPDTIMGFFSGIGTWLWDSGRDLVQGLLDGIKSLGSTIGNFFLDLLPGWIVGPFKAALGIASPSKVFHQFGRDTVNGYLNAVEDMRPQVEEALAGVVDTGALEVASTFSGSANAQAAREAAGPSRTVNYYAAENQSLDAEEALLVALASPRVKGA